LYQSEAGNRFSAVNKFYYDGDGARAKQELPYQNVARGVTPTTSYATPNALGRITDENLVANSTSYPL